MQCIYKETRLFITRVMYGAWGTSAISTRVVCTRAGVHFNLQRLALHYSQLPYGAGDLYILFLLIKHVLRLLKVRSLYI